MYNPQEDSHLILKHINEVAKGNVLEIGTGSGILALEAAKYAEEVIATDIQEEVIKKLIPFQKYNLKFIKSDLFSSISKTQKFDLIICNPPYLPEHRGEDNVTKIEVSGGKQGFEFVEKLLTQAKNHLKPEGKILLLFSSLTNKDKVDEIIKQNNYEFNLIDEQSFLFEKLYVYLIKKK